MRRFINIITLLLLPLSVLAQSREELDRMVQDALMDQAADVDTFSIYAAEALEEYLKFEAELRAEYEEYKKKVMGEWGEQVMVESTRKVWVEYGKDDSSRTIVDFETGKVTVEVLLDEDETDPVAAARMETAVADLLASRGRTLGFDSEVAQDGPITDTPIMTDQLDLSKYGIAQEDTVIQKTMPSLKRGGGSLDLSRSSTSRQRTSPPGQGQTSGWVGTSSQTRPSGQTMADRMKQEQASSRPSVSTTLKPAEPIAKTIVKKETPKVETVKTSKGNKKVMKIELELVEDHIPKRAQQFKSMIKKHSKKFSVDEPLIFAIMEQESAFNPAAKSHVPAYGLMQLVPRSGGRDAYRFVHKEDVIPTADFLYDPDNNIELGTGYLRLLMTTSFAKVEDPRCRMLCAIAAYNTGAGNVSRAITGNTNISKAIPTINTMNYNKLFNHLKKYLPHAETQDYIEKVTSKMEKYIK